MLKDQGGVCAICHKPPKEGGKRLHTDHDHIVNKVKITSKKQDGFWYAEARWPDSGTNIGDLVAATYGYKKSSEAKQQMRQVVKKKSVRGLLCWHCNAGLKKWNDDPDRMESAAKYIRIYREKLNN